LLFCILVAGSVLWFNVGNRTVGKPLFYGGLAIIVIVAIIIVIISCCFLCRKRDPVNPVIDIETSAAADLPGDDGGAATGGLPPQ
jgi:hypothetical protein